MQIEYCGKEVEVIGEDDAGKLFVERIGDSEDFVIGRTASKLALNWVEWRIRSYFSSKRAWRVGLVMRRHMASKAPKHDINNYKCNAFSLNTVLGNDRNYDRIPIFWHNVGTIFNYFDYSFSLFCLF